MMAGCYSLDIYCDDLLHVSHNRRANFTGRTHAECARQAKEAGWSVPRKWTGLAKCPACRKRKSLPKVESMKADDEALDRLIEDGTSIVYRTRDGRERTGVLLNYWMTRDGKRVREIAIQDGISGQENLPRSHLLRLNV